MGAIVISDNKHVDYKDLEAHVSMNQERNRVLEERIARAEREIEKIHDEQKATKKTIIGTMLSIITGSLLFFLPRAVEILSRG